MAKTKRDQAEYQRQYYLDHKEEVRKRGIAYRAEHKEGINAKKRIAKQKYVSENKEEYYLRRRGYMLMHEYGITLADYDVMLIKQGGLCKICKRSDPCTPKKVLSGVFAVDHDHNTGKVRGLLCFPCNAGLGKFQDKVEILQYAIDYLHETS